MPPVGRFPANMSPVRQHLLHRFAYGAENRKTFAVSEHGAGDMRFDEFLLGEKLRELVHVSRENEVAAHDVNPAGVER